MMPGPTYGVPMSAGSSYGGGVMMNTSPYTAQFPVNYQGGLGVPMDSYGRSRSASFSYPQQYAQYPQQYMQPTYMPGGVTTSTTGLPGGGQLVIIQKPKKSKRHHRRSRSSDGEYDDNMSSRSSRR
jgi:hypothetical protein